MAKPNIFDRAVIAVAPVHAAKRAAARAALSVINSGYGNYGANLTKKSMRGWEFYGGSPKEDIEDNINVLRQRSRDAYMGIPTAAAALKTIRIVCRTTPEPRRTAGTVTVWARSIVTLRAFGTMCLTGATDATTTVRG